MIIIMMTMTTAMTGVMLKKMFPTVIRVTINDEYNNYGDDKSNNIIGTQKSFDECCPELEYCKLAFFKIATIDSFY